MLIHHYSIALTANVIKLLQAINKKFMKKAFLAIKQSFGLLKSYPLLVLPFVLLALFDGMALYFLFLAPQEPFAKLLAPPIAHFYGEQFVHYPWHLLKLPILFTYARLFLGFLPGMFLNAFAIGLIGDIKLDRSISLSYHSKNAIRRFFALLVIWLLSISFFIIWIPKVGIIKPFELLCIQAMGWNDSKGYLTFLEFLFYFLSYCLQILFLYALPLVILAEQSLFRALIANFRYLKRLFFPTLVCISLVALFYLSIYIFERDLYGLADRKSPEIILVVLAASIPVSLVINIFIITTSTLLFIDEQKSDPRISLTTNKAS